MSARREAVSSRQELAIVNQAQVQAKRETPAAPAASGLSGLARTGVLLMGMAVASVLLVDLPIPAGRAADGQGASQPYVPASDRWIDLGVPQRPDNGPVADQVRRATAAPAAPGTADPHQVW
jgi:hypothetical protein